MTRLGNSTKEDGTVGVDHVHHRIELIRGGRQLRDRADVIKNGREVEKQLQAEAQNMLVSRNQTCIVATEMRKAEDQEELDGNQDQAPEWQW